MHQPITVDEIVSLAGQLSALDKVRLIERLAPQIAQDLQAKDIQPRKSLRGLWRGVSTSDQEIEDVRKEIWQTFPREDISRDRKIRSSIVVTVW
jgi:hypothetical protein